MLSMLLALPKCFIIKTLSKQIFNFGMTWQNQYPSPNVLIGYLTFKITLFSYFVKKYNKEKPKGGGREKCGPHPFFPFPFCSIILLRTSQMVSYISYFLSSTKPTSIYYQLFGKGKFYCTKCMYMHYTYTYMRFKISLMKYINMTYVYEYELKNK